MTRTKKLLLIDIALFLVIMLLLALVVPDLVEQYRYKQNLATSSTFGEEEYKKLCGYDDGKIKTTVHAPINNEMFGANEEIGYIYLPSLNLGTQILQGDLDDGMEAALEENVVHAPDSSFYGDSTQTTVLLGHRDLFMANLEHLKVGDPVIININGNIYTYVVSDTRVIDETDVDAVYYSADQLVMYTCYPFIYGAPYDDRYIVVADPVEEITCI